MDLIYDIYNSKGICMTLYRFHIKLFHSQTLGRIVLLILENWQSYLDRYPISCILYPVSCILYPVSCILVACVSKIQSSQDGCHGVHPVK
jgi:hypothetical protein